MVNADTHKEPDPLDDAIRAQQSVINQLADQHAEKVRALQDHGKVLAAAHDTLTALILKKNQRT